MPSEILLMILAFLIGGLFQYFIFGKTQKGNSESFFVQFRSFLYKSVVVYLLFKIGFKGGAAVTIEPLDQIMLTSGVAVMASVLWTLFLLLVLPFFSKFDRLTQVSIAAHFGAVSVGTFIAGLEFLQALEIEIAGSVVVWLAVMELPALLVGVWALKIRFGDMFSILKNDYFLWVLIGSIFAGVLFPDLLGATVSEFLFVTIFTPILAYFLFEMGAKASASIKDIKGRFWSLFVFGTIIPLLGGLIGASLGMFLDYSEGEAFVLSILMASASYVLVPISLREILKSQSNTTAQEAEKAIATSMALSVGITLPFNIIIGFEVYYFYLKFLGEL